jgi:biotin carboxyl carrier protein
MSKSKDNVIRGNHNEDFGLTTEMREVVVQGSTYQTKLNRVYQNRKKWSNPDDNELFSFIPGTVVKFLVKEGDSVNEGDPILLLEAMKMENTILAPKSCKIKKINVNIGEKIPKGTLMVEFE